MRTGKENLTRKAEEAFRITRETEEQRIERERVEQENMDMDIMQVCHSDFAKEYADAPIALGRI